jgi:hypothetical protein
MSPLHASRANAPYLWNQARNGNTHRGQYSTRNEPSATAILSTIAIIFCVLLMETIAHISIERCDTAETSQPNEDESSLLPDYAPESAQPEQGAAPSTGAPHDPPKPKGNNSIRVRFFVPSPGPSTRGARLFTAFAVLQATIAGLVVRISNATFGFDTHPDWPAIIILNIIPFTCAIFAFLRIVTEMGLMQLGTGLGYKRGTGAFVWLPFMPFSIVFAILPMEALGGLIKRGYAKLRNGEGRDRSGNMELRDEELGLVEGMDGLYDEGLRSDGPPGYDEVVNVKNNAETRAEDEEVI